MVAHGVFPLFVHCFMMTSRRRRMELETILNRRSVNYVLFIFLLHAILFLCCSARDYITTVNLLGNDQTLVSAGKRFELGFFSPTYDRTYVGIWFSWDSRTVVWVANRDKPLPYNADTPVLAIVHGNLKIIDAKRTTYWSTDLESSMSNNVVAQLLDSGNLVLSDVKAGKRTVLWESFANPTDTFLPGMKMEEGFELVSWNGTDDPANGSFTFQMGEEQNQSVIWINRTIRYWDSGKFFPSDNPIPPAVAFLFSNFTTRIPNSSSSPSNYSNTRVVMNATGEVQYWRWDNASRWSLIWNAPGDGCSVFNACGKYGICNLHNSDRKCNCLTGFKPVSASNWEDGDFSGGCTAESVSCENNIFLNYTKVRVAKPDLHLYTENETHCREYCAADCQCKAYSYDEASTNKVRAGSTQMCWIWREDDLTYLQEEYSPGRDLFVRLALSAKESTSRNCKVCGTMIVPYPLSSGPNCGDPMYSSFQCDPYTSQLSFNTDSGIYPVSSINPDNQTFIILANITGNCDARTSGDQIALLADSLPSPFTFAFVSLCSSILSFRSIGIGWEPPAEPTCTSSMDCKDWPFSSCNAMGIHGYGRCVCNTNFKWNSSTLNCTISTQVGGGSGNLEPKSEDTSRTKNQFILIIVITVISASLFSCAVAYIWTRKMTRRDMGIQRNPVVHRFDSERHAKDLIETSEFKEKDKKGIDVPFFEFESILAATDNFSDANKLGQGGYGPVYKGKLPGGQEIAVKRLSSVSGQGLQEFKNEVVLIAKLQHRNLVKLWGYCVKGDEKILVYEYMRNRSLDAFIFDGELAATLDWEMRFNIILGIARGLLYLHQDSRLRIIHRDMKTSNILLDEEMNPKISDFGLARIVGGKQNEANTNRVVGTYGYMAPEYALDGIFSVKSDVFSFGVVMLEIVSGKKNTGFYRSQDDALSLLGYAWKCWEADIALELMDQTLSESCNISEFMRCINVGLLCIQEEPNDRPNIATVIGMLGNESATLPSPKQPAFVARGGPSSSGIASSSTSSKPETKTQFTSSFVEGR